MLGEFDLQSIGDPETEILPFLNCKSPIDARVILHNTVEEEVSAILDLVEDADAFDVIELMRMREFSIAPDPRLTPPGSTAVGVEIIAAILLGRRSRKPSSVPRAQTRPHEVIPELHERASKLARIASYRLLTEGYLRRDELGRLAGEYQGAVLNIRNLQYDHIRDEHDRRLFGTAAGSELMQQYLGFSFSNVKAVRSALNEISAERMTLLRDETGDIVLAHQGKAPDEIPEEIVERFKTAMTSFCTLPGDRAAITVDDVVQRSGMDATTVNRILCSFAQQFDDSRTPPRRVKDLLTHENPFLSRPLMSDGGDAFALSSNDIGVDVLRRMFERALPTNTNEVRRYDKKARQLVSEELATKYLTTILGTPPVRKSYHYLAPRQGFNAADLESGATDVIHVANDVEGDALFVVDDVAFVVEVKGKSIAEKARRGDVNRLRSDLVATLGAGARQANRVRELIETNHGLWESASKWLYLSHIREIRTLVVVLDDIGPLGTNLADLKHAGILPDDRPPLVLSLHDLAVIAEIGERPSEFLVYMRLRTDSPVTVYYRALDELDLYTLFLSGGLYIPDDPDEIKAAHRAAPPVSRADRRRYQQLAVGTRVGDNTAQLTAWMNRENLPDESQVGKPSMNSVPEVLALIDDIQVAGWHGWLRCCADILALSGEAQFKLVEAIKKCAKDTRRDRLYHDAVFAYAGMWGFPTLFLATHPSNASVAYAKERLLFYAKVKQYQFQSDRAYGLIFDEKGALEDSLYLSSVVSEDSTLDQLVEEGGVKAW